MLRDCGVISIIAGMLVLTVFSLLFSLFFLHTLSVSPSVTYLMPCSQSPTSQGKQSSSKVCGTGPFTPKLLLFFLSFADLLINRKTN